MFSDIASATASESYLRSTSLRCLPVHCLERKLGDSRTLGTITRLDGGPPSRHHMLGFNLCRAQTARPNANTESRPAALRGRARTAWACRQRAGSTGCSPSAFGAEADAVAGSVRGRAWLSACSAWLSRCRPEPSVRMPKNESLDRLLAIASGRGGPIGTLGRGGAVSVARYRALVLGHFGSHRARPEPSIGAGAPEGPHGTECSRSRARPAGHTALRSRFDYPPAARSRTRKSDIVSVRREARPFGTIGCLGSRRRHRRALPVTPGPWR